MQAVSERAFANLTRIDQVSEGLPVGRVADGADQLTFNDAAVVSGYIARRIGLDDFTCFDFSQELLSEPLVLDHLPLRVP